MPKNRSKAVHEHASRAAKPYRAGIVVVHGVGKQKRGATVEHVARRIDATLREMDVAAELSDAEPDVDLSDAPQAKLIDTSGTRPVLIAEAHWADIVRDTRKAGWRAAIARGWFIIAVLPYLLSAALAPRAHEMKKLLAAPAARQTAKRSTFRSDVDELVDQAPTMWRGLTAMAIVLAVVLAFTAWPAWVALLVALVAVGLMLLLTRSSLDVIEHVRMAGLGREQLRMVLARVGDTVDHVADRCDEVWVVGHSQGGFIAHRLLKENPSRWSAVRRFTGVASGLRPISLIAAVSNRWWIVAGWLWMAAIVLLTIGVLWTFEPGGPFNTQGSRSLINAAVILFAQGPLALADPSALSDLVTTAGSMLMPTQWWWLTCLLAAIALVITAVVLQRRGGTVLEAIPPLPKRIEWHEVSSPSDLVGSMSVPDPPDGVTERGMPSLRQPVVDHLLTSYLGRRSMFRFEIAQWMTRRDRPTHRKFQGMDACTRDLTDLAERTYRLRMTVQLMFLVFAVVLPAVLGASLLTAASTVLYIGMLIAVLTAVIAGAWWTIASNLRVRRFLSDSASGTPAVRTRPRTRSEWSPRIVVLAALVSALGGWGCYLLATLQESTGFIALKPVVVALRMAGITLIGVVPLLLVAFCLAVLGLRGVRAICWMCILVLMNGAGNLMATGDPWAAQGWPGITPLVLAVMVVGAALLWSRPRRAVNSEDG